MDYLDKEVIELRKYRAEHRDKCGRPQEPEYTNSSTSLMTQRIVELSKKNRELSCQTEAMKTKINKLLRDNESLKNMVECFRDKDVQEDLTRTSSLNFELETGGTSSQQNVQLTNKVIEYRRQTQLLRMELKTALRALSQEVGDGATPHSVLSLVSGSSGGGWRGRQQQIISLQQKCSELQLKLKETVVDAEVGAGDQGLIIAQKALAQQDKKKQEQIEKLTQDLEHATTDLKSAQKDLKASKARIQTLDSQIKVFKSQIEILEGKLTESDKSAGELEKEIRHLKLEQANLKERERRYRDQSSLEIQEGQRAVQRERGIVSRLQEVIQEKQETVQKQDSQIIELRNKLEISCSGTMGKNVNIVERIGQLESQLENSGRIIEAANHEKVSIVKMMNDYLTQAEEERRKYVQSNEYCSRISCVLQRADQLITECLDAGQVTSEDILQEVEHIRTLIRELKLGDLYVYENVQHKDMTKKLKTQVEMLKREVSSLKANLKDISNARRKDLQSFAQVTDQLKNEWTEAIKKNHVTPSVFSR